MESTQDSKWATKERRRINLTPREISESLVEGIITIILLLLLSVSILIIVSLVISSLPSLTSVIWNSKNIFAKRSNTDLLWNGRNFIIPFFFLLDIGVLYWRSIRRYRQMQLWYITSELHYIANGNYNHHAPSELSGDLSRVVTSINGLVGSTVATIEDERKIEKSKDELITNVSHDIRTPLTPITGCLGLIGDDQYHSEEDLLKYTHTICIKAKQMKSLVNDLFEYTEVCQPAIPVNLSAFDVTQLIE